MVGNIERICTGISLEIDQHKGIGELVFETIENVSPVFFEQYLTVASPPILEFHKEKKENTYLFTYKIVNALDGFAMPIVMMNSKNEKVVLIANGELNSYSSIDESLYLDLTSSYFELMKENE